MEVLLMKPLVGKGNAGEVIDVKIHYANNYLFPQGIAVPYDKQTQNQRTAQAKKIEAAKAELYSQVQELVTQVETANGLTFYKQATDTDTLYDSISEGDIAQHIHVEHKVHLDKKHFALEHKIESLGEYTVNFKFEDIEKQFPVHVVRNEATA